MSFLHRRHAEWTDRFSDYLAGDLAEHAAREVEEHLDGCGACRTTLAELRSVIAGAGELEDLEPSRDLWAGIAAAIQAPVPAAVAKPADTNPADANAADTNAADTNPADAKVIALPIARTSTGRGGLRVTDEDRFAPRSGFVVTAPQLIAASLVLIAASALATWTAGPGLGVRGDAVGPAAPVGQVIMATGLSAPPEGLAEELSALEAALAAASSVLDPNTVRVLERNLDVIEQAIEDSSRALAQDPGNDFLVNHLEQVYQRKLTYLRDAARVAEWAS